MKDPDILINELHDAARIGLIKDLICSIVLNTTDPKIMKYRISFSSKAFTNRQEAEERMIKFNKHVNQYKEIDEHLTAINDDNVSIMPIISIFKEKK